MIDIKYSKAILNLLFGKRAGGDGMSRSAETAYISDHSIPASVTAEQYSKVEIISTDSEAEKERKRQMKKQYDSWKEAINSMTYYYTKDSATKDISLSDGTKKEFTGWERIYREELVDGDITYPSSRYLALFTSMPDANGKNYVEPFYGQDSSPTTYRRVSLDNSYFSDEQIMLAASQDQENGGAFTNNKFTIYYPEIVDVNWATADKPLVGFGIFENEAPVDGEIPYLWGALSNTDTVTATVDHIPLFRVGEFKLSIS